MDTFEEEVIEKKENKNIVLTLQETMDKAESMRGVIKMSAG